MASGPEPPQRQLSFNHGDEASLMPGQRQQPPFQPAEHGISPIERRATERDELHMGPESMGAPPPPAHKHLPAHHPGAHPDSHFDHIQAQRFGHGVPASQPRQPAAHSQARAQPNHGQPITTTRRESFTTPGMDNLGERAAGGGITGLAIGVANNNERESGVQALRDIEHMGQSQPPTAAASGPAERQLQAGGSQPPYPPYEQLSLPQRSVQPQTSYSSQEPLADSAYPLGASSVVNTSDRNLSDRGSLYSNGGRLPADNGAIFSDNPYSRYSSTHNSFGADLAIDPDDIADDGDDGLGSQESGRRSMLSLGRPRQESRERTPLAAPVGAAGVGAVTGPLAPFQNRDPSGNYGPVPGGSGGGRANESAEKQDSEWLSQQTKGNKRLKWIVGTVLVLVLIGAIVGGVVGGILSRKGKSGGTTAKGGGSSSETAGEDDSKGDLGKDSQEIQDLLNNPNLHKVFPGIDYTPLNGQYPDCINNPPSQNNITRDMAVISQLTNAVRLYGTDCNQTAMVLHAIDRLELTGMKVWLGVWLDTNKTTNARQMAQFWSILDQYGEDPFAGVIVGNEILFRNDMTAAQLDTILQSVRQNMTSKNINLPLASSDLGDNWSKNPDLITNVDIVMANIHPFFGGVPVDQAAGWTWDFWTRNDVVLTKDVTGKKNIISEVGWPSGGGNDCGTTATCANDTVGAVASVDNMNKFMNDWVCQSLDNGTVYFWFESFDEPWKVHFNEPDKGKEWEDKWGLLDVNRNLKDGLKIPDCGGKEATKIVPD